MKSVQRVPMETGIDEKARKEIAQGLSKLLADTYFLYVKTQNFHWNVTGPHFPVLHDLFEGQYKELAEAVDEIAERIRALDVVAPGSFKEFASLASMDEETGDRSAEEMIRSLLEGHQTVIRTAREAIPAAEAGGDEATLDLLAGRLASHEKTAWMLRSLLQA